MFDTRHEGSSLGPVSGTLSGVHTVFSISPRDRANDFAMESDSAAEDLVEVR